MKIAVVGTGYVGLPTGACLAEYGNDVVCIDIDSVKINKLQKGESPIYEPGLDALLKNNTQSGRLTFSTSIAKDAHDMDLYLICVGTPSDAKGHANLEYVWQAAQDIAEAVSRDAVIAVKSTVPVGTTRKVNELVQEKLKAKKKNVTVSVAFTPEFLKQGKAVSDTLSPDRVVIGVEDDRARRLLENVFAPFQRKSDRTYIMDIESAEMTKYAANVMLATRISLMNELASICDFYGADIEQVREGVGSDPRIGPAFLYAGIGYGGSCFPKDVDALIKMAEAHDFEPLTLNAVKKRNDYQKSYLYEKIEKHYSGQLKGKTFAMWGLTFKPDTDDIRQAPSLIMTDKLVSQGARGVAFDPLVSRLKDDDRFRDLQGRNGLEIADSSYQALEASDGLILITEWKQFRAPDFERMKSIMNQPVIFDGRNQYSRSLLEQNGFYYFGVGR